MDILLVVNMHWQSYLDHEAKKCKGASKEMRTLGVHGKAFLRSYVCRPMP